MKIINTLLKIFAWQFYRENSGLLLFSYIFLISYCFFIKTVGNYQPEESVFYHLMLMMTFIVSPVVMLLVFAIFLIYTIKSWKYVAIQLKLESNQFLFYSLTASKKAIQFKAFVCVQLAISFPMIGYWLFATILGIVFDANVIPLLTLAYLLVLAVSSALLYCRWLNLLGLPANRSLLGKFSKKWSKPLSTLFLYCLLRDQKSSVLISKCCSFLIIIGIFNAFPEQLEDQRLAEMTVLGLVMTHSFLIYKEHHFNELSLSFLRNMPYQRIIIWLNFALTFAIIILPEIIWLLLNFQLFIAGKAILLGLSIAMLLRSLIYLTGLRIYKYLSQLFFLLIIQFYVIMFNYGFILIPINLIIAFAVFFKFYYSVRQEKLFAFFETKNR